MSGALKPKPRIGVPYRTKKEQLIGDREKIGRYLKAVQFAGAKPVAVPLDLSSHDLLALAETLDGIALSGSPADLDPGLWGASRHAKASAPDSDRERTDFALLEHCFAEQKPILAICYGIQSLNVFLGGSLVQDIPDELHSAVEHNADEDEGSLETFHTIRIEPDSRLAELAMQASEVRVNSSHHQSALTAGRNLRVTARAADGVIEALELAADGGGKDREGKDGGPLRGDQWLIAVQWHPERMVESDALALALFRSLAAAASKAPVRA
jgi:putative glutamine amidotransferase